MIEGPEHRRDARDEGGGGAGPPVEVRRGGGGTVGHDRDVGRSPDVHLRAVVRVVDLAGRPVRERPHADDAGERAGEEVLAVDVGVVVAGGRDQHQPVPTGVLEGVVVAVEVAAEAAELPTGAAEAHGDHVRPPGDGGPKRVLHLAVPKVHLEEPGIRHLPTGPRAAVAVVQGPRRGPGAAVAMPGTRGAPRATIRVLAAGEIVLAVEVVLHRPCGQVGAPGAGRRGVGVTGVVEPESTVDDRELHAGPGAGSRGGDQLPSLDDVGLGAGRQERRHGEGVEVTPGGVGRFLGRGEAIGGGHEVGTSLNPRGRHVHDHRQQGGRVEPRYQNIALEAGLDGVLGEAVEVGVRLRGIQLDEIGGGRRVGRVGGDAGGGGRGGDGIVADEGRLEPVVVELLEHSVELALAAGPHQHRVGDEERLEAVGVRDLRQRTVPQRRRLRRQGRVDGIGKRRRLLAGGERKSHEREENGGQAPAHRTHGMPPAGGRGAPVQFR